MCLFDKFGPKVQKLQKLFKRPVLVFYSNCDVTHKSRTSQMIWQTNKPVALISSEESCITTMIIGGKNKPMLVLYSPDQNKFFFYSFPLHFTSTTTVVKNGSRRGWDKDRKAIKAPWHTAVGIKEEKAYEENRVSTRLVSNTFRSK